MTPRSIVATMRALVWRASWPLRKLSGWDLGYASPLATPAPRPVYGEAISLFGVVLTNAVALTLSQQQATTPAFHLLIAYGMVVATILSGMVIILNATYNSAEAARFSELPKHAYERGSIMFLRIILIGSVLFAGLMGLLAWEGQLPGQTFSVEKPAEPGYPQEYKFKGDNTKGVMVPVSLGSSLFPNGIPSQLNMQVSLSAELGKDWSVEQIVGYVDEPGKQVRMEYQPVPLKDGSSEPHVHVFFLDKLNKDGRYLFKVYLHAKEKAEPSPKDAIEKISNRKGMQVMFLAKVKK